MSERMARVYRKQRGAEYHPSLETVQRYLPGNYTATETASHDILIRGEDNADWTLDGYVLPRLASGLIRADEIPAAWPDEIRDSDEPEDGHPAGCDGTVTDPEAGFGGQDITGTCQHPSHGEEADRMTEANRLGLSLAEYDAQTALARREAAKLTPDYCGPDCATAGHAAHLAELAAMQQPTTPAIIGTVNAGYRIIAAVPTDLAARNFVVCGVAEDGRRDVAATWRVSVQSDPPGALLYWSKDLYTDRDTAMADMLTRAGLPNITV